MQAGLNGYNITEFDRSRESGLFYQKQKRL